MINAKYYNTRNPFQEMSRPYQPQQLTARILRTVVFKTLILSSTLGVSYIFSSWYSVSGNGSDTLLAISSTLIGVFFVAALGAIVYTLFGVIGPLFGSKGLDRSLLSKVALFSGIYMAIILLSLNIGARVRYFGYKVIAQNGRPIVSAIDRFESEQNAFPSNLTELVPGFLPNIPKTGLAAYPDYKYVLSRHPSLYNGNPWILVVPVSVDTLSYDCLVFFPNQEYPKDGPGRNVRGFANWALIEEGHSSAMDDGLLISNSWQK